MELTFYLSLIDDIKSRIRQGQIKASLSLNTEMILMYWDIGAIILKRQKMDGWGKGIIPKLAKDLKNDLPEVKGFSERNLGYMLQLAKEYPDSSILQQAVAKLPWGHTILLMQRLKNTDERGWYIQQTLQNGWGRDTLAQMIKSDVYLRQGRSANNFGTTLPSLQSELVKETLKNPYSFDFLTLTEPFTERELEIELVKHLEKFLLELGAGFAFVGRQYELTVSERDFYLDLLFYHLKLRCFVVVELKKGEFKPEYAGKMNFYCSAVDDLLRHPTDNPTIGLILCQTKDKVFAEYALKIFTSPLVSRNTI